MIRAVVLDVGGVFLENPAIDKFWKGKGAELRNLFGAGKISEDEFAKQGAVLLDIKEVDFIRGYKICYAKANICKEVVSLYENVKVNNFIFTDTNALRESLIKDKMTDIYSRAKSVFKSNLLKLRKSDKGAYKTIADKIGYNPSEILIIDDKREHLESAKKEGMSAILYLDPKQLEKELAHFNLL